MPHINFNVPFVNESGEPIMQVKLDQKNLKIGANGQATAFPLVDAEGNVQQEPASVRDHLVRILNRAYPGDDAVSMADKATRGKLARKVQNNNSCHYSDKEIAIIEEFAGKAATTTLAAQLDDLIHGGVAAGTEAA
jgi:hypothetical protein